MTIARTSSSVQLVYLVFFITCKRDNIQTEYVCVACFHRLRWISLLCSSERKFQFDDCDKTAVCLTERVSIAVIVCLQHFGSNIGFVTSVAFVKHCFLSQ